MGRELVGYVQTLNKNKWEVLPLKARNYMNEYEYTDIWRCGDEVYDVLKEYGTYLPEEDEKALEEEIFTDPEERSDYDSECIGDKRPWHKIGLGGLKYLAIGMEIEDEEDYKVKRQIDELVKEIETMLRLTNFDYKSFEDVRFVFYLSF